MRQGVRAVTLRGLWIHPRHGGKYYRTRRGGQERLTRLPDLPVDHPDFLAAWAAAARAEDAPKAFQSGTIGSIWRAALASDLFFEFSPAYRAIIQRQAKGITDRAGAAKAGAVAEKHVRADLRDCTNPRARLKAWRFWARFAIDKGWITSDPTAQIRLRLRSTTGHPAWSSAEIEAFRAAYPIGSTARAIMELTYWTGARISDAVKIGPPHLRQGVLVFRQTKTQDMAYVPWTCALPDYASDMSADRDLCRAALAHIPTGLTFLQTAQGRARSHKAAGHVLAQACRSIELERSAHGLRKARAISLAEAGATPAQIGAWTGHRSLSEIAHYTREMDRFSAVMGADSEQKREPLGDLKGTRQK